MSREASSLSTTDLWEQAKQIFEELCDRPAGERAALLARACGDNHELRQALDALLLAHESAGDFLDTPIVDANALFDNAIASVPAPSGASEAGRRIGRYELREPLGEGGFGTVWLAEQHEPLRRTVALKLIKPGMDTRQVIARFGAERQALGLMDHPNIARVFDGGQTDAGRPYFVMELVRGEPITKFCNERRMGVRERLALFVPVCRAVHHAHQKGLIHRDIKPGNVLVTLHDGQPAPKVIDFGVAKAIGPQASDVTLHTSVPQLVGTPAYMSPEQIEPGGVDVDIRSDVYALGVLLYELLTGATPFDSQKLRRSGLVEIQRMIRDIEPRQPSSRLEEGTRAQRPEGRSASAVTCVRAAELRGDLDWIVMKCLEKDRARRYGSASDIAEDIERHLRQEPVSAGPPSNLYRFGKLVQRHRGMFAAGGAIAALLVVGVVGTGYGLVEARQQRDAAKSAQQAEADLRRVAERREVEAETARAAEARQRKLAEQSAAQAAAINNFLQEMLGSADPRESARRDITVREVLDKAVAKLDGGDLRDRPETEAAVRLTIGRSYRELARYAQAEPQIDAAIALQRGLHGEHSVEFAQALQQRATLRKNRSDYAGAQRDFRQALAIIRERCGPYDERLVSILSDTATSFADLKQVDEADALLNEALAIARRPEYGGTAKLAEVLNNKGFVPLAREQYAEAAALFSEAIAINRVALGNTHPNLATNLDNLAQALGGEGDLVGADAAYRESLAIRREIFGSDHPDVAITLHNHATLLFACDEREACEAELREALEILKRFHGLANVETLVVLDSLVSVHGAAGNLIECERLLLEGFAAVQDSSDVPASRKAALALRLAALYQALRRPDDVLEWNAVAAGFAQPLQQP